MKLSPTSYVASSTFPMPPSRASTEKPLRSRCDRAVLLYVHRSVVDISNPPFEAGKGLVDLLDTDVPGLRLPVTPANQELFPPAQTRSSGAMVIARPALWMRSAICRPRSYETSGMVEASAAATPWNVLWLSFRTTTFQGAPRPVPVPRSTRSFVAGAMDQS